MSEGGFRLSPLEMRVLIHHFVTPSSSSSPFTDADRRRLFQVGFLDRPDFAAIATSRGEAWLERALSTPLPVQRWVWKEDER